MSVDASTASGFSSKTPVETSDESTAMAAEDRLFAGKRLFWLPVLPLVALDLWSKWAAFDFLRVGGKFVPEARHEVFDSWITRFELVNWHNPGTVWGLFQDFNQPLRLVRLVAIAIILWFVYKTPRTARVTLVALGLIMAGALGNLYDNFLHTSDWERDYGAVRDFLFFSNFFGQETWDFPAFNVADSCITVGAATLFVILWSGDSSKTEAAAPAES